MAKRATRRPIGIQDDNSYTYRGDTFPPRVRAPKVGLTNYRVSHHNEEKNEEGVHLQLDLLDEVRAMAE